MTGHTSPRIAALGTLAAALLLTVSALPAAAVDKPTEPGELTLIDTPDGKVLADKDGNPLYLRDADKPDTPDCTGECATTWPAAIGYPTKADDVTGETAQTESRPEGTDQPQVIYETHPLYYFKDDKPNAPQGQKVAGWSLIGADGKAVKAGAGTGADTGESPAPDASASASPSDAASDSASAPASDPASASPSDGVSESPGTGASESPGASEAPDASESAGAGESGGTTPVPSATSPGQDRSSGTDTDARTGTGDGGHDTGALKATPSGAARGGAQHAVADAAGAQHGAGPLALGSAALAVAAGGIGLTLLRRRRAAESTGTEDGRS